MLLVLIIMPQRVSSNNVCFDGEIRKCQYFSDEEIAWSGLNIYSKYHLYIQHYQNIVVQIIHCY